MLIVSPVVTRPLLDAWEKDKAQIAAFMKKASSTKSKSDATKKKKQAYDILHGFLTKLRSFTVLDPACGSGNFLYLALQELKDIEHRAQLDAEALGLDREFPQVGPENVQGIEINPFAAELARISVWIGEIQWMRRHGFSEGRDPILKPLQNVECRDAILARDGTEPDWPDANVIIGNPPFLGGKLLLSVLGQAYTDRLRTVYESAVPGFADLVCYWFHKAGRLVARGKAARCGLVATNSIRGGKSRVVLDRIAEDSTIFDAWSDEPWVVDGAAVRVSLACFAAKDADLPVHLDGAATDRIASDLSSGSADLTTVQKLAQNRDTAFVGDQKSGPFDVLGDVAREWLRLPTNPNGRPNSDVLKPWCNGRDIVQRPSGKWIIDFGPGMSEEEAALYEAPFAHAQQHVLPMRMKSKVKGIRDFWWRHWCPRPAMWHALRGMARYIATPTVAKHRLFVWLDARICPDHQLIVIARDDDTTFGILHSRFHEAWSLRLGTWLGKGNDPRYTPTTTFLTFPFPGGLTPDVPASDYADDSRAAVIARAARRLTELRDRWLNPPEWLNWVEEPVSGYPKRAVPQSGTTQRELKKRTLTRLYNARPQWLLDAHATLDAAVAGAYGWDAGISDEDALASLLALNMSRAA